MDAPLSSPLEKLREHYDVVVIGSGYGGGIASSRLARAGRSVCLLERGEEKHPGDYPNTGLGLLDQVQFDCPKLRAGSRTALFDVRYNSTINVVVGCGLGGTSLINAGVCLRPDPKVFASEAWPAELRDEMALDEFFARAEAMLKPSVCPSGFAQAPKPAALGEAAKQLGKKTTLMPVLVNFEPLADNLNHVGVTQYACVGCGDCVTGCNYRAKNTVLVNYLPDAKNHSAEIFTRARVLHIEKTSAGWWVHGKSIEGKADGDPFTVRAGIVILAAGTLGSTEILLRSYENGLRLSEQIGHHFSSNGDMIGFAYNTGRIVNGIGLGTLKPDQNAPIGPTATVMVDFRADSGLLLEEAAIPGALADFLAAALAIDARLFGSQGSQGPWERITAKLREAQSKFFGAYTGATRNTETLILLARDDSMGRMFLNDDRLRIDWPGLGQQPQFEKGSDLMHRATLALGGTYLLNPIWNELTDHNLATAHPLGGCVMADDAGRGAVNHKGQVFSDQSGDAVHEGLYVMDGSVVPTALGVNPLLTISALAERSCHLLAGDNGWVIDYTLN